MGTCSRYQRAPRLHWAGLLRRVFKLDVFSCARGGGRRRVLAYLTHAAAFRPILQHLNRADTPAPLAPARWPPQQALWG
ncbi:ATP-dependent helicase HrpA [Vitiosangium sp. GDMCC 1.1324]|nr:ATP-dependent helicase HrpA [Vitiosangium sp. GDMCC 1.1324]